jgi:hypothetical protein
MNATEGPEPKFGGAEHRVRCRIVEHRADTPVEIAALLGRQKERRITIAQPISPGVAGFLRRQRFGRKLGAGDQFAP